MTEETYDHVIDGTLNSEKNFKPVSVLLASSAASNERNPLHILEPGITRIPNALALMSEIQLKGIVDRLSKVDTNQNTDGDEMMTHDGLTFSKYSYQAMELGLDVCSQRKNSIDKLFEENVG